MAKRRYPNPCKLMRGFACVAIRMLLWFRFRCFRNFGVEALRRLECLFLVTAIQ